MAKLPLYDFLTEKVIISTEKASEIRNHDSMQPFSIYWELRLLLYLGVMFLSSGLGILIYENINTIGHNILIGFIAILSAGCYFYAFKHRKSFTWQENQETNNLDDFALIGGCLTFLTLEGYLQYQYTLFGTSYGIAAFLPAILFLLCAYIFDHRGVLSMGITAFASWVGISITPLRLLKNNDFNSENIIITALFLGFFLIMIGWGSIMKSLKKHFSYTYFLFGGNLAFIAALAGLFTFDYKFIYGLIVALLSFLSIKYARTIHSYLFLLMGVIYGYIAFTYTTFELLPNEIGPYLYMSYFMLSGMGVVFFLIKIKRIVRQKNESL
ncbi:MULTISPECIES: DUF2157 domain-containing protein [Emticicia]|uniref:DUF2157 domain-containing protein n=1 Tax=Emticicia TaxID=312278 RepID=UPI0007D8B88B|nr:MULTISPECIES: DUF2157 domain-containing protein [Emticicia]